MAGDDKTTKASPAPKKETVAKKESPAHKKDEGQPNDKITSGAEQPKGAEQQKAEGGEKTADAPAGYHRGEGQKPVSNAYRDNWNAIYAKKKKR